MTRTLMTTTMLCALLLPGAAFADPVPDAIVRIITEAARSGDTATLQTTADLAKKTNPRSVAEIDSLVAGLKSEAAAAKTDKLERQGFFEGWTGQGEVGGSLTTGTSKDTTLALGLNLAKDGVDWRHTIIATANYQHSDGVTTANRFLASYEGDYKFTQRLFALGLLQWEQDRFSGYNSRYTETLGLGYSIFDGPEFTWQISGGPALRQTQLITHMTSNDTSGRFATQFLWNISAATIFSEDAGLYVGGDDNTYFSTTAITTKIMGALSARVSFNVINESNPLPGIEGTNTISRFTLVYGF
jgi:putative salt-induced outer membrane protein